MTYREAYEAWKHDFATTPAEMAEIETFSADEKEIEDRFYKELEFGTAGMRGVIGAGLNRMNVHNVRKATAGLADYIHQVEGAAERGVVIAYDSRRYSPEFAMEAALVLAANGIRAMLFPSLRPVPVLSFAVRHLGATAGIVITASHNPRQYNGYKVYWADGAQLPPEPAGEVLARIRARTYESSRPMLALDAMQKGLLTYVGPEVDDAYIEALKTLATQPALLREEGCALKIVYSPLHGSGNIPVRRLLSEMGVTPIVVPEQESPDPAFPTVAKPNPEEADTLKMSFALADKVGADVCFATDPDCDRLGVAVRKPDGSFLTLTGNQIGCLLLHHVLTSRRASGTLPENGAVVKSIVSTELARRIASSFGVKMIDTLTGFKFIAEQIQLFEETGSNTFLFGFEESHGYLSSTFVRDKDAVNASLLVTELALSLKRENKTLWDRMEEIFGQYGYAAERVKSILLPGKDGLAKMSDIMTGLRTAPPSEIGGRAVTAVRDYLSGTRTDAAGAAKMGLPAADVLYFELADEAWACVRPSGTEPVIKLYVATTSRKDMADAATQAAALLADAEGLLE